MERDMISLLDIKQEQSTAPLLNIADEKTQTSLSFSDLLKGIDLEKVQKNDEKFVLVLEPEEQASLAAKTKTLDKGQLATLLRKDDIKEEMKLPKNLQELVKMVEKEEQPKALKRMQKVPEGELKESLTVIKQELQEQIAFKQKRSKTPSSSEAKVEQKQQVEVQPSRVIHQEAKVEQTTTSTMQEPLKDLAQTKEIQELVRDINKLLQDANKLDINTTPIKEKTVSQESTQQTLKVSTVLAQAGTQNLKQEKTALQHATPVKEDEKEILQDAKKLDIDITPIKEKTALQHATPVKEELKEQIAFKEEHSKTAVPQNEIKVEQKQQVEVKELVRNVEQLLDDAQKIGVDTSAILKKELVTQNTQQPITLEMVVQEVSGAEVTNIQKQESITNAQLRVLVNDAKSYLKEQIQNKQTAQQPMVAFEAKELPKTLKGLMAVATSVGIDVKSIKVEEFTQKGTRELVQKFMQPLELSKTASKSISTQEMVSFKDINTQQKPQKSIKTKADETLQLLLRGQKVTKQDSSLTSDFSLESAKVIPSATKTEPEKTLESLLHGNETQEHTTTKSEGVHISKTESLEVKINEAKQMVRYLSQDVKTAIENYKAPFTRVKVQLNPQKLGEMEITVVQRGKNMHINLSSNNAAINTLAMNAQDLKVQLHNTGIQNATLNFSNNSGGDAQSNANTQHQQQNRDESYKSFNYFERDEENEELLSSLEIVVPNYA